MSSKHNKSYQTYIISLIILLLNCILGFNNLALAARKPGIPTTKVSRHQDKGQPSISRKGKPSDTDSYRQQASTEPPSASSKPNGVMTPTTLAGAAGQRKEADEAKASQTEQKALFKIDKTATFTKKQTRSFQEISKSMVYISYYNINYLVDRFVDVRSKKYTDKFNVYLTHKNVSSDFIDRISTFGTSYNTDKHNLLGNESNTLSSTLYLEYQNTKINSSILNNNNLDTINLGLISYLDKDFKYFNWRNGILLQYDATIKNSSKRKLNNHMCSSRIFTRLNKDLVAGNNNNFITRVNAGFNYDYYDYNSLTFRIENDSSDYRIKNFHFDTISTTAGIDLLYNIQLNNNLIENIQTGLSGEYTHLFSKIKSYMVTRMSDNFSDRTLRQKVRDNILVSAKVETYITNNTVVQLAFGRDFNIKNNVFNLNLGINF